MSLTDGDRNNLKLLGKECKQAQFPVSAVVRFIQQNDPAFGSIVNTICLKDDGRIDAQEAQLIRWARTFIFTVTGIDALEAEMLIQDGYYSA